MSLIGSQSAAEFSVGQNAGSQAGELWELPDVSWPRRLLSRIRRKKTLLYRSKDEFGLFELSDGGWREVARLQDAAKPATQRLFRYLLQQHASDEQDQPLRLSPDYVTCVRFAVTAERPEQAEALAHEQIRQHEPWPGEDWWSGHSVLGVLQDGKTYSCVGAFVRKSDVDEIRVLLEGYGWPLERIEFADAELDCLIQLSAQKAAQDPATPQPPTPRRRGGRLIKVAAVALIALELAGAANILWLLNERSGLSARLDAARQQTWTAHDGVGSGILPPSDLEDVAASRLKVSDVLSHIGSLLPGDAVLTSMHVEDGKVQFSGSVRKTDKLLETVRQSELLVGAHHEVPSVRLEEEGIELFSFKAAIRSREPDHARE